MAPRIRLPGGSDRTVLHPPGTFGPLAALGIGDVILGIDEQDAEIAFRVVAVDATGRPGAEDALEFVPSTGELRITVRTGAYLPTAGTYDGVRTLTADRDA